jgi:hypothetical protein
VLGWHAIAARLIVQSRLEPAPDAAPPRGTCNIGDPPRDPIGPRRTLPGKPHPPLALGYGIQISASLYSINATHALTCCCGRSGQNQSLAVAVEREPKAMETGAVGPGNRLAACSMASPLANVAQSRRLCRVAISHSPGRTVA